MSDSARARVRQGAHPRLAAWLPAMLVALDVVGLGVAAYLSIVELGGGVPVCGPLRGCEDVARSPYARIGGPDGLPVAVLGVALSLALLTLAVTWWRTDARWALAGHYGLSLVGVSFEAYFLFVQVAIIGAVCVWCATYGLSLVARFALALLAWRTRDDPA